MVEHPQGDDEMTTWYDDEYNELDGDGDWPIKDILDDVLNGDEPCWVPLDESFDDD